MFRRSAGIAWAGKSHWRPPDAGRPNRRVDLAIEYETGMACTSPEIV